jgi:sterol 3beta-glucosyltransferase
MAAVIHHGGAGTTTAAALHAAPQLVVPHLGDQFYHGSRVAALGLGVDPIPLRKLTASRLVEALSRLEADSGYKARAVEFASGMRHREGTEQGRRMLEAIVGGRG